MRAVVSAPFLLLPWESTGEEDRRFRQILGVSLLLFVFVAVTFPFLPVEEIVREEVVEPPPPLARIVLEKKTLPPPKPEPALPKPKPVQKVTPKKPTPRPVEPVQPVQKPKPKPKPVDKLAQAKKAAAVAGVMAFQDDLAALRDNVDVDTLNQTQTSRGQPSAEQLQRSIVTSKAAATSGGIKTAALSSDVGGAALSGRETTVVESQIGGKGKKPAASSQSVRLGGRSDEAIRRVMDKNKGAIFAIYNRALRRDPLLEGKLVFEMVIAPNGAIASLQLLSSELVDEALTQKILSRIRLIQFGAAEVTPTRVNYSFDFLPYS